MRFLYGILMFAPLGIVSVPAAAEPGSVTLVTVPIEGMTYCCGASDKPNGPLIDVVHAAMKITGMGYSTQLMPWARAIHLARTEANTCAVGLRKTADNHQQYQWAGPIMRSSVRILARKGAHFHAAKESDMAGKSIGVLRGSAYAAQLERAGAKVEQADSLSSNINKLIAGRIDLMATSSSSALGAAHEQAAIVELFRMDIGDAFVACHRALDSRIVTQLNDAISNARTQGALREFGL